VDGGSKKENQPTFSFDKTKRQSFIDQELLHHLKEGQQ
jgi:hypothetical protein